MSPWFSRIWFSVGFTPVLRRLDPLETPRGTNGVPEEPETLSMELIVIDNEESSAVNKSLKVM